MKYIFGLFIMISLLISNIAQGASPKFFQTCAVRNGGDSLVTGDDAKLGKFDLIILNRFEYNDFDGQAWKSIKSFNPNALIYVYQLGAQDSVSQDTNLPQYRNAIDRYSDLNTNHPEMFLLDSSGSKISDPDFTDCRLMDFGLSSYQSYWASATQADIGNQPWVADGIFVDRCDSIFANQIGTPAKYPTDATWVPAMNSFVTGISKLMSPQRIYCNSGNTITSDAQSAWKAIDASATPPDALHEGGAWAVKWGSSAVQFYSESAWKGQIDLVGQIHHAKTARESHCNLTETGPTGTDNYGNTVGFWDVFWYSMCSYLIGKNTTDNNSYFAFVEDMNMITWYGEFDSINLGNALGTYQITNIGGTNIYWRQHQNGYVYVNPTGNNVSSITLRQAGKQLNHTSYTSTSSIPIVTSISLLV